MTADFLLSRHIHNTGTLWKYAKVCFFSWMYTKGVLSKWYTKGKGLAPRIKLGKIPPSPWLRGKPRTSLAGRLANSTWGEPLQLGSISTQNPKQCSTTGFENWLPANPRQIAQHGPWGISHLTGGISLIGVLSKGSFLIVLGIIYMYTVFFFFELTELTNYTIFSFSWDLESF